MIEKEKTTLFAGPWVGELGWELFCWQGMLRKLAPKFDRVIVASRPEHDFLYRDFCHLYLAFDPGHESAKGPENDHYDYNNFHRKYIDPYYTWHRIVDKLNGDPVEEWHDGLLQHKNIWIPPESYLVFYSQAKNRPFNQDQFKGQHYVRYGQPNGEGYDLLLHARNLTKISERRGDPRNWPIANWNQVVKAFPQLRIACIGSKRGALSVEGTTDLRGIPLEKLADVMASSRLIIGPSSGPMHFAALCGLPHLFWSKPENLVRYQRDWNPFQTPCYPYVDQLWQPDVNPIVERVEQILNENESPRSRGGC